jgi:hypothetical protein
MPPRLTKTWGGGEEGGKDQLRLVEEECSYQGEKEKKTYQGFTMRGSETKEIDHCFSKKRLSRGGAYR